MRPSFPPTVIPCLTRGQTFLRRAWSRKAASARIASGLTNGVLGANEGVILIALS